MISYEADESRSMSVRLDGQADASYADGMRLDPMFRILEEADRESPCENLVHAWAETWENETYGILYMGRRSFDSYDGLIFLSGDADGDGQETSDRQVSQLLPGGEIVGYEVSLYLPDNDEVTPVRYIMEPEYRSPEELQEEQQQETVQTALTYLTDKQALTVKKLYTDWEDDPVGYEYKMENPFDQRRNHNGGLWKLKKSHAKQLDWYPGADPTLWEQIVEGHAGTLEDPIPVPDSVTTSGFTYVYGKYYKEGEEIYLCKRAGVENPEEMYGQEETLYYAPSAMVGQYFEKVG